MQATGSQVSLHSRVTTPKIPCIESRFRLAPCGTDAATKMKMIA